MTSTPTPAAAAAQGKQLTVPQQRRLTLRVLFDQQKPELAKLLPRNMDPERLLRMALTECVKNPELLECTAESWALAMQVCAAQGLFPDSALGLMYLVPRKNRKKGDAKEVSAMRGYQGDIELARRSGEIDDIYAEVVYTRDHYKVTKGLNRSIEHVPYDGDDDEPGALRAVYAVAKLKSGEVAFVTLRKPDVMRHKSSAQGTDRDDSPWRKHEASMWKKTAIHELFKWLPKATEKMAEIARSIATDGQGAIDTTAALALGEAQLPGEPSTPASLADRLEASAPAAAADAPAPASSASAASTGCAHEKAREYLATRPVGTVVVCGECAQELRRRERDPGDDDDAPFEVLGPPDEEAELKGPEDVKRALGALAGAAGDPTKPRSGGRQGRLSE